MRARVRECSCLRMPRLRETHSSTGEGRGRRGKEVWEWKGMEGRGGKGRKGKERKGKERKGKERKEEK